MVGLEAERHLRDLGMRGDVIKTMHRAFTERGQDRSVADYVTDGGAGSPIIGRLVDKGLHDELTGEAYAVIDGTDGRAHHVRFRGIEAFEQAPPVGGIVEVRRFGSPEEQRPTLVLATRSDLDLRTQITAPGATWIDHRLVEREQMPLSMGGFGREVRDAMQARAEHLADEGLGRRQGQRIMLQRDLLSTRAPPRLGRRGREALGRDGSAACEGRSRRECLGHISPAPDALLGPLRHDRRRGTRWGPRLPARALVARDRTQARPAHHRRRSRRRHRVEPRAQARSRSLATNKKGSPPMSATKILWGQIIIVFLIVLTTRPGARRSMSPGSSAFRPSSSALVQLAGMPDYFPPAFFAWWFSYDAYAGDLHTRRLHRRLRRLHCDRGRHQDVGVAGARSQECQTMARRAARSKEEVKAAGLLWPGWRVLASWSATISDMMGQNDTV